jgi:hypothetical protein
MHTNKHESKQPQVQLLTAGAIIHQQVRGFVTPYCLHQPVNSCPFVFIRGFSMLKPSSAHPCGQQENVVAMRMHLDIVALNAKPSR